MGQHKVAFLHTVIPSVSSIIRKLSAVPRTSKGWVDISASTLVENLTDDATASLYVTNFQKFPFI